MLLQKGQKFCAAMILSRPVQDWIGVHNIRKSTFYNAIKFSTIYNYVCCLSHLIIFISRKSCFFTKSRIINIALVFLRVWFLMFINYFFCCVVCRAFKTYFIIIIDIISSEAFVPIRNMPLKTHHNRMLCYS